ncbi:multidrug ABC transporter substrate-binding protein [Flavobacterium rivuli WB 3.3-2 = DSM 21788]|uniref:Multidrug ABC transporter substrate-binding protein n=1 Tax=Flavobacterium rivuli WB 3.3-2 = DSM 21788 TaxID=1121895 RepID=A0A0A2LYF2_9FLAO|nr:ABC transporter permease [Flavobacterium rivuli]KGO85044.1 multidrug ABC transporter substrate-binding protein [Flavobacterium rivuli WB 3.3-2 = DSM 21788]
MFNNWLKIFLYQIKNNKFFTLLNLLGLSMGIAGLVFAILYWNDEHEYNAWNPEKERVFSVSNDLGKDMIWASNIAPLQKYLKGIPNVESYCYLNNWYQNEMVEYSGKKEQLKITNAQSTFFSFFPFRFIEGDANNALKDDTSIAISEKTAQKFFGTEKALGRQLKYADKILVVRGVYRIPGKSSFAPEMVVNMLAPRLKQDEEEWGNYGYGLLLKLKDPAASHEVEKAIEGLYYEYRTKPWAKNDGLSIEEFIKVNGSAKVILEQLATSRLHSVAGGYPEGNGNYLFLAIMAALSILIIVLSIVNYVNLTTANAIKRAKEVGVRKILGATKANIVRQFIFEAVATTLIGVVIALVIVELVLPFYNNFLQKTLVLSSNQFYLQLIAIFIIVVIAAGIFPAVYVANFETLNVLKGNFSRSKSGIWLRNGMLILQFAIASFFITGSYVVYQQVNYMSTKDLGFKGEQIVQVNYIRKDTEPKQILARYNAVKQELLKIKGVQAVSSGAFTFGSYATSTSGYNYNDTRVQAQNMAMDFGMLEMMQIKMAKGRMLSDKYASDTISNMLINEVAMNMMKEKDPIGKVINWNDQQLKIVGVVKDFHVSSPQTTIPPMSFFHYKTVEWFPEMLDKFYIKLDADTTEATMAEIEKLWTTKVNTENPFSYDFVDKGFARTYESYVKQRNLFSLLNAVVIIIALFGLFALASYSIERRMKDIAIRKTLGAQTKALLTELSKQYIVFCIIGFLIAFVPAWLLLNKWLDNFAFRITISAIPFIVGFVVLMALTLTVVLSRAYMATRVNVLKYLKYE